MSMIFGDVGPFTASQVQKLVDIPQRTLHAWDQTGLISPSVRQSQGRGAPRLYSFADLVAVRVARDLRRAGVSMQGLRKIVKELQALGYEKPLSEAYLIAEGNTVLLRDHRGLLDVLKTPMQRCILDFEGVVEDIKQKVKQLQAA